MPRSVPRPTPFCLLVLCTLTLAAMAAGEMRGVVGAAGPSELRAEKDAASAVVATVKAGEAFVFEADEAGDWARVTLASGKAGWLPLGAIRFFYDQRELPRKDPSGLSEIDDAARRLGFDYAKVTRLAAQGDARALRQFFALAEAADGAAAESIAGVPTVVYHLLGDAKFARWLAAQAVSQQTAVRNRVLRDGVTSAYLQGHFPESTRVLFPSELVAWPSPDGRYAIRKVFSDAFDLAGGRITRAELIERKTGAVRLDFTADDIGTGADREGAIVWAPDSQRFASVSTAMNPQQGNLFDTPPPAPHRKQTAVYQRTGDTWGRVALPLDPVPGRERDTELAGARLGHDYIEPIRWSRRNVLLLERHEYYRQIKPIVSGKMTFNSIVDVARWHSITATISSEGKATLVWKLREDR